MACNNMANYFDQIRDPQAGAAPPPPSGSGGNYFDQARDPQSSPQQQPMPFNLERDAPQMGGVMRPPAMAGSNFLGGFTGALAPFAGAALNSAGMGPGGDAFTPQRPDIPSLAEQGPMLTPAAQNQAYRLTHNPSLQPQNEWEKALAAGSEGIGQTLPFMATGGIVPTLAGGFGGGVGGMYGERLGEKLGYPTTGRVAGSLLGGTLGATTGQGAERGYNALTGNYNEMGQAYRNANVPIRMTGDVSEQPFFQQMQEGSAKALGGAGRTQAAAKDVTKAFGTSVEDTASSIGSARTLQQAGAALQGDARQWIDNIEPARHNAVWAPVNAAMSFPAAVLPDNYRTAARSVSDRLKGLPETRDILLSKEGKQLLNAINADVPPGAGMSWEEAQNMRTALGEAAGVPKIVNAIGDRDLTRLYGALSADMRTTAIRHGAGDLFDAANAESTSLFALKKNLIGKIIGSPNELQENIPPERAAQTVLGSGNNGDFLLSMLRREMPNATNELAAYKLRDIAAATAGKQNAAGNAISPSSFLTDWNQLSPEAKGALYPDALTAGKIRDLAKISEGIKESYKMANPSVSASHIGMYGMVPAAIAGAEMGHTLTGSPFGMLPGAAAGATVIPAFGRGMSYLGANRVLANILAAQGGPRMGLGQQGLLGLLGGAALGQPNAPQP